MKRLGRYAAKIALGLVPFQYNTTKANYGRVKDGPPIAKPKREPTLRKGRHVFVGR